MRPLLIAAALLAPFPAFAGEIVSDAASRTGLGVTIFENGFAMIREHRTVAVRKGPNVIAFEDVSSQLQPETLLLSSDGLTVSERNFEFDLLTPEALLSHSVGKEIRIRRDEGGVIEKAVLLSTAGGIVLQFPDHIETALNGTPLFDTLPAGLRAKPALLAKATAKTDGSAGVDLSYLTTGLSWKTDYVAELESDAPRLSLSALATLSNTSGLALSEATVKLLSGSVNKHYAQHPPQPMPRALKGAVMAMEASVDMAPQQESLGERYLYTLPGTIDLNAKQTKQVALIDTRTVDIEKILVLDSHVPVYGRFDHVEPPRHPSITLSLTNGEDKGLGLALPAGTVRVYGRDGDGERQFLGEDRLDRLPIDGKASINLGHAFDVTVKRSQTKFSQAGLAKGASRSGWLLRIDNKGTQEAIVELRERIPGVWRLLESSEAPQGDLKIDSENRGLAVWKLTVPAGANREVAYEVLVNAR